MTTMVTKPLARLLRAWQTPTPLWPLALYRIAFGLLLLVGVVRFFWHGWIDDMYVTPRFYFTYPGFAWVTPWPAPYMHAHFVLMGMAALGIAAGCFYRISAAAFFVLFTYVELLDKTNYLNHYYLVSVIALMLVFMPAANMASVDAWRKKMRGPLVAPGWCLRALKLQAGLVYFFAGVAKLNVDWLWHAQPLKIWLQAHGDLWLVGAALAQPWVAHLASVSAAAFDLSAPFFLLSKRFRPWAFGAVVAFHLFTALLFNLGLFPWLMIVNAALFFAPTHSLLTTGANRTTLWTRLGTWVLVAHFALQILLPLRHFLYDGSVAWTEEAYRFAWNVMRTEKAGRVVFSVQAANGSSRLVYPREYLTALQEKMMSTQPDMMVDLARHIAQAEGAGTQVFAEAYASLNGRRSAALMQPDCDLAQVTGVFTPNPCIQTQPLAASPQDRSR